MSARLEAFRYDFIIEKILVQRNQTPCASQRQSVLDHIAIKGEKPCQKNKQQGEKANSLVPAQTARRKLHDLTKKQTACCRGRGNEPTKKKKIPVGNDFFV
ncbi:MAG: hypothetical protein Q8J76_00035 [Desulfobulbaceae bacterium]|nr:hypothetical protein [Desulfobulbaceae bacterium]